MEQGWGRKLPVFFVLYGTVPRVGQDRCMTTMNWENVKRYLYVACGYATTMNSRRSQY